MDLSELARLTKQNKTADILRRAKARVDTPEKWFGPHHMPRFGGGRLCAGMALESVGGWDHPARTTFCLAIGAEDGCMGVVHWNNAPERTHAEVMQAFDAAIAMAEQA